MDKYQPIIGLEIHVELKTKSKMFCRCSAQYFGEEPNTHVCPVCLGLPGALPVPNKQAIEWCVMLGMALNCQIPSFSKFDRKNYFYPDLPKGYQISQYDLPFCTKGWVEVGGKKIEIRRVHQEEDTAKLIHQFGISNDKSPAKGEARQRRQTSNEGSTLIDFNRSGVPLVEVVTEPDIPSAAEAKLFLQKLQQIIRYLGISDCDMEKGSMRLEPNVSLRKYQPKRSEGAQGFTPTAQNDKSLPPYKVEVKNINSFRFVERAIEYEIKRQTETLEKGGIPVQETRGFDEKKMATLPQRGKEEAQDYRYFPEPDIPLIRWRTEELKNIRAQIPELPDAKLARFVREYNLPEYDAVILTATPPIADYFEELAKVGKSHGLTPKQLANVLVNKKVDTEKILPAELVEMLLQKSQAPIIDKAELGKIVEQVLHDNPAAVADYKKGKSQSIMFLVGCVMRVAKGQADAGMIKKMLEERIKKA
ncbi:MAG: Asp-tRNA(Asn)/Glu-tRNA(Gln) amidotransferase subunit GatB [bacterium]|nr:Asp-tRNA(Asn)/Glu-tRNA(Gln) amidotransferase subunit GatB [bacterium]